jgi:hypothetical protein
VATSDKYRAAAHESVFRSLNESIENSQPAGEDSETIPFRCECARVGCNARLPLARETYEQVRANPRWFVVLPGHELPEVERVISTHDGYIVVEKRGDAGDLAETMDPRS